MTAVMSRSIEGEALQRCDGTWNPARRCRRVSAQNEERSPEPQKPNVARPAWLAGTPPAALIRRSNSSRWTPEASPLELHLVRLKLSAR